jgi:hypothetical protein
LSDKPRRRQQSWMRSQSEGFRPIKQIGVAGSIGMPLMVVGGLMLVFAATDGATWMWIVAGSLFGLGLITAASGRII